MNKKGFTLVELLVAIVLIGLIGISISRFFIGFLDNWNYSSKISEIERKGRVAIDEMTTFIRQSSNPVSGLSFSPLIGGTSEEISFICVDSDGNKNMRYYISGDDLYREVDSVSTCLVKDGVNSVYFTHTSSYVVEISSLNISSDGESMNFSKYIHLRNE